MKKLLQLLNEYWKGSSFQFTGYDRELSVFNTNLKAASITSIPEETIISKKFWFIQWLITNNKVNRAKEVINDIQYRGHGQIENVDCYSQYDSLLMLLAIHEDPIEFLVSLLK